MKNFPDASTGAKSRAPAPRMFKVRSHLKRGEQHELNAKEAVQALLKALKFDPALYSVFETWDKETRGLVRGCEAVALQGTRLCVKVPSTVHRQELSYVKDRIVERLNQALGRRAITDVYFELP